MSRKTIALISGLVLLTVILVALAIKTSQPQPSAPATPQNETNPTVASEAKTTLYMTPEQVKLTGNTASVNIGLDAQDNDISGVQMEISYDPKKLSFVSVTPSALFAQGVPIFNKIDKTNGRISYAVALSTQQSRSTHTGKIDVATLVFAKVGSASAGTSTEIQFLPKSLVSASGVGPSVLKSSKGATVQF